MYKTKHMKVCFLMNSSSCNLAPSLISWCPVNNKICEFSSANAIKQVSCTEYYYELSNQMQVT